MRIRVYKRGPRWWLDYKWGWDPEKEEPKRQRYPVADYRKDADSIALSIAKEIEAGTFKGPAYQRAKEEQPALSTFAVLAERWLTLKAAKVRPSTLGGYHNEVKHLRVYFGEKWTADGYTGTSRLVSEITASDCKTLMARKLEQARKRSKAGGKAEGSTRTANKYMTTLRGILDVAVDDGTLPRNPAARLTGGKSSHAGRALEPAQADAILANLPAWARSIIEAFWHTGTRRSELLGFKIKVPGGKGHTVKPPLTWGEVDLEARLIRIPRERTKDKKPRVLGINDDLLAILRGLPSRLRGAKDPAAPVFLDERGKAPNPDRVYRLFQRAAEDAKIPNPHTLRLHDIRHSVGTAMADLGAAPHEIRDALGHANLDMTNRYIKASQKRASAGLARLSGTLKAQSGGSGPVGA